MRTTTLPYRSVQFSMLFLRQALEISPSLHAVFDSNLALALDSTGGTG